MKITVQSIIVLVLALNFMSAVAHVLCKVELLCDEAWVCLSGGVLYRVFRSVVMICEVCRHAEGCHFEHIL
jgi:hypothetical protein